MVCNSKQWASLKNEGPLHTQKLHTEIETKKSREVQNAPKEFEKTVEQQTSNIKKVILKWRYCCRG